MLSHGASACTCSDLILRIVLAVRRRLRYGDEYLDVFGVASPLLWVQYMAQR